MSDVQRLLIALTAASWLSTSCDGEKSGDQSLAAKVKGIYEVSTFTENSGDCTMEGPSVLGPRNSRLLVTSGTDVVGSWVRVWGCATSAVCRDLYRTGSGPTSFYLEFRKDGGDHLEGGTATTGLLEGGVCKGAELDLATLTSTSDQTLRIEVRGSKADHPPDAKGDCNTKDAGNAAQGKPCVRFQVITATRSESL